MCLLRHFFVHGRPDPPGNGGDRRIGCTQTDPTDYLTSVSMLDPWESLRTNVTRQILAAESAKNGKGGPEFDVYDIGARLPAPAASVKHRDGNGE